jgi:formate hydrogenlyase regulatory protein HycA
MAVPSVIPIVHEAGYHTDTIGAYTGGQFLANFSGAFRGEPGPRLGDEVHWYAYVHRFDDDGVHLSSNFRFITTTPPDSVHLGPEERERGERELAALLDTLDGRAFGDIAIRLFQVEHGGVADGEEWVELYPEGLGFHPPWDGEYDT